MIGLQKKVLIYLNHLVKFILWLVNEDCDEMITLFHNTEALLYCDENGNTIGSTDVFDRIEVARKHFIKVGLGENFIEQFIR